MTSEEQHPTAKPDEVEEESLQAPSSTGTRTGRSITNTITITNNTNNSNNSNSSIHNNSNTITTSRNDSLTAQLSEMPSPLLYQDVVRDHIASLSLPQEEVSVPPSSTTTVSTTSNTCTTFSGGSSFEMLRYGMDSWNRRGSYGSGISQTFDLQSILSEALLLSEEIENELQRHNEEHYYYCHPSMDNNNNNNNNNNNSGNKTHSSTRNKNEQQPPPRPLQ